MESFFKALGLTTFGCFGLATIGASAFLLVVLVLFGFTFYQCNREVFDAARRPASDVPSKADRIREAAGSLAAEVRPAPGVTEPGADGATRCVVTVENVGVREVVAFEGLFVLEDASGSQLFAARYASEQRLAPGAAYAEERMLELLPVVLLGTPALRDVRRSVFTPTTVRFADGTTFDAATDLRDY